MIIRVRLAAVFSRNLTLLTGCVVCCASTILPRCPRLRCSSPGATSSLRTDSGSSFLATRWRTVAEESEARAVCCPGYCGHSWAYGGHHDSCLLYTSDAADDLLCVDLGGRRF